MATATDKAVDELKADLKNLREDLNTLMGDITALRKSASNEAARAANGVAQEAQARVSKAAETIEGEAATQLSHFRGSVQENPYTAVAAAFGIGVLVSQFMHRR